ncbi:HAD family phosphatase [Candidatus Micrarchaeota archaeon]|nr:HAD family phosphatase [Candidatus Micrarchaeota archaeon]
MFKGIIFDMDGVLFNSQSLHFSAERMTIEHFNGKITDTGLKNYLGWTESAFWAAIREKYALNATVDELIQYKRPIIYNLLVNSLHPDQELQIVLSNLKKKGLRLGVASSSERSLIILVLNSLGIKKFFEIVVSGEEVLRSKPAPDIFLKAAADLKVDPNSCIVVEDAPAGILAANSAGMYSIALQNETNSGLDLSKAKKVITNLNQLMKS